jgi:adenine-specific DNA-methyltransferase
MGYEPEIIQGDCLTVLPTIAPGSVALVLTSPPYNIGKEYETRVRLDRYAHWLSLVLSLCARTIRDDGALCLQTGNYVERGAIMPIDVLAIPPMLRMGYRLRNRVAWEVDHGLNATKRFSGRHETICWFTAGDRYTFNLDPVRVPQKHPGKRFFKGPRKGELSCNPLGKNPGDVWAITQVKNNHPEKTAHPCQFPEELVRRLVLALTNEGDLVLDPFAGSGTVGKVCRDLGRRCVLIEREPEYVEITRQRLAA